MSDKKEFMIKISKELYNKFVLNDSVVSVQGNDGIYRVVKTHFSRDIIFQMLEKKSSIGTVQQQTFKDTLKWICLDFDCKNHGNIEDLNYLKHNFVDKVIRRLEEHNINSLLEFSGRRGFHVWIIFDEIITKDMGYRIVDNLTKDIYLDIIGADRFSLDLFPKVPSSKKKNKYGLQVKIPLSRHKLGCYSYFIEKDKVFNCKKITDLDKEFLREQIQILESYKFNRAKDVITNLQIDTSYTLQNVINYTKEYVVEDRTITIEELEHVFKQDKALALIWKSIKSGEMSNFERLIVTGLFSHLNNGSEILNDIFKMQNNYSRRITNTMILKHRKYYFPVTFRMLYIMYLKEECQDFTKGDLTVDKYILKELGIAYSTKIIRKGKEKNFWELICQKEYNYMHYNDEVINVGIRQRLLGLTNYDYINLQEYLDEILNDSKKAPVDLNYFVYCRKEKNKTRKLVSLDARERVLTTAITFRLMELLQYDYDSYSYHLNIGPSGDVFYPWISSWKRFKEDVSNYFIFDFFEDYFFVKIDIKKFYDHVYIQILYNLIEENDLSKNREEVEKILKYLISLNEKIMVSLNGNVRGVPQGPVYARVIAELTLDMVLKKFIQSHIQHVKVYRYVDDIYMFHDNTISSEEILKQFAKIIESYGLYVNKDKTVKYGRIKDMTVEDKRHIEEFIDFNYELCHTEGYQWKDENEKRRIQSKFESYINKKFEWSIEDVSFILSNNISEDLQWKYIDRFGRNILASEFGRGSVFRKFYTIIFDDVDRINDFLDKKLYLNIPINSINFKNMISLMMINIKTIIIKVDNIKAFKEFLAYFLKQNIDNEERILLDSLSEYLTKWGESC